MRIGPMGSSNAASAGCSRQTSSPDKCAAEPPEVSTMVQKEQSSPMRIAVVGPNIRNRAQPKNG